MKPFENPFKPVPPPEIEVKVSTENPDRHTVEGWDEFHTWAYLNIPQWQRVTRLGKEARLSESDQQKFLCYCLAMALEVSQRVLSNVVLNHAHPLVTLHNTLHDHCISHDPNSPTLPDQPEHSN